jgi:hypothetical protein
MEYLNKKFKKLQKERGGNTIMKKIIALVIAVCVFAAFSLVVGCKKAEQPAPPAAPAAPAPEKAAPAPEKAAPAPEKAAPAPAKKK